MGTRFKILYDVKGVTVELQTECSNKEMAKEFAIYLGILESASITNVRVISITTEVVEVLKP